MAPRSARYERRRASSAAAWSSGKALVDSSELNALIVDLQGASDRTLAQADVVVRKTSNDIERNAKQITPVDTGFLRNSIGFNVKRDAGGIESVIGPSAAYGYYVERGTSTMAPRAFMGPSLDRYSGAFAEALGQVAAQETL